MSHLKMLPDLIQNHSSEELQEQRQVVAKLLPEIEEYLARPGHEIMSEREFLPPSLTFLALLFGSEHAHKVLTELRGKGVTDDLAAVCSVQIMRRLGEFDLAPQYLQQIYFGGNQSFYVGQFLSDSYAALGDTFALSTFSELVLSDSRKIESASQRDLERWATLLLDFALVDHAGEFIDKFQNEKSRTFFHSRLASFDGSKSSTPLYVINLDHETRKWSTASSALNRAGHLNVQRHPAVLGKALSKSALNSLVPGKTARAELRSGAIACWLSHNRVWESIADGTGNFAAVLEDDALPFTGASYLETWTELMSDFDLVWINRRMSGIAHQNTPEWTIGLTDPWEQLSTWPNHRQGWGADGYLLSKRGAAKLLEMSENIGIINHVDGQLGALSINPSTTPTSSAQKRLLGMHESMDLKYGFSAVSLNIPVVRERPFGVSSTANIHRD